MRTYAGANARRTCDLVVHVISLRAWASEASKRPVQLLGVKASEQAAQVQDQIIGAVCRSKPPSLTKRTRSHQNRRNENENDREESKEGNLGASAQTYLIMLEALKAMMAEVVRMATAAVIAQIREERTKRAQDPRADDHQQPSPQRSNSNQ